MQPYNPDNTDKPKSLDNPAGLLSARGLNTLLFSDPYSKLCFTASLATSFSSSSSSASAKVAYIDLDTAFTAYLVSGKIDAKNVDVYLPSEGRFMNIFQQVLVQVPRYSVVILDSINAFYAVYYSSHYKNNNQKGAEINHLLSVLLMLLVRQGVTHRVPVLATSMLRFRKEGGWRQSPASRRLLQKKSVCKMQVENTDGEMVLRILEHDTLKPGSALALTRLLPLH